MIEEKRQRWGRRSPQIHIIIFLMSIFAYYVSSGFGSDSTDHESSAVRQSALILDCGAPQPAYEHTIGEQ